MGLNIRVMPKVDSRDELAELVEIDRWSYKSDPPKVAFEWAENFPWVYTLLKRQTEKGWQTMGYGVVIPTDKFILEGLRRGEIGEEDIRKNHIRMPNEANCFYVASFGTRPNISTYESSRLVGNVTGGILRAQVPVVAVAITSSGERVAREVGLTPKPYTSSAFQGIEGYTPKLLEKEPFVF